MISVESCRETFNVVKDVFRVREVIGRPVELDFYHVELEDTAAVLWDRLCEEHGLPCRTRPFNG